MLIADKRNFTLCHAARRVHCAGRVGPGRNVALRPYRYTKAKAPRGREASCVFLLVLLAAAPSVDVDLNQGALAPEQRQCEKHGG